MTQVDGACTNSADRILISQSFQFSFHIVKSLYIYSLHKVAATNIPWEIDEAVLRLVMLQMHVLTTLSVG